MGELSHYAEMSKDVPLHQFLGGRPGKYGNGYAEVIVPVSQNLLNGAGVVHGGIFYVICDIAATLAFSTALDQQSFYVTHDLNISLLKPAFDGELIARANCIKVGRRLGFVECKIYDSNDQLLAVARITKSILPKPENF